MTLAEELEARGLIERSSAPPAQVLGAPRTAYLGVDPTADSLQIGNLAVVLLMRRLADAGHKVVFLVGGATGLIGDPRERGERAMLEKAVVAKNLRRIKKQLRSLLPHATLRLVDNAAWLPRLRLLPFLQDVGKRFTVNELVKRELVATRLSAPDESISYAEFSYGLLQAYDFLVLNEKYGCDLQVGASDQWTNILAGVDLIRKKNGAAAYALTAPLVTDATGKKFGKSEGNAVWLDPEKTSPFSFHQFWVSVSDEVVERYLKAYTFLPLSEIAALMELHRRAPENREAQETLARLVTEIVHGAAAAAQTADAAEALFGPTPFTELPREAQEVALAQAPSARFSRAELAAGVSLAEALCAGGLASSKSDARRLIQGKAVTLSGRLIEDSDQKIYAGDLNDGPVLVRKGRQSVLFIVLK